MVRLVWIVCLLSFVALGAIQARTWTDRTGRTLEAEFLDVESGEVKVRRAADQRIFWLPYASLSVNDQKFVNQKISQKRTESIAAPPRRSIETNTVVKRAVTVSADQADRALIPSLLPREIGRDYANGPTCLMNFLVWWNETGYEGLLVSSKHERALEQVDSILASYTRSRDGTSTTFGLAEGIRRFSEKQLEAHQIDVIYQGVGPEVSHLEEGTTGWSGMVALVGLYENSGSQLKRVGGRFISLVWFDTGRIIFNYKGESFTATVQPFPLDRLDHEHQRYFRAHKASRILELLVEPSSSNLPFVRVGRRALIDSAFTMLPARLEVDSLP